MSDLEDAVWPPGIDDNDDDGSTHNNTEEKIIAGTRNGNGKRKMDDDDNDQVDGTGTTEDSDNNGGDQAENEQSNGDTKERSSETKLESPLKKTRNNENRANKRDGRKDDNYDNLDGRSEKPKAFGGRNRLTAEELVDPTKEDLIATRVFLNEADMARVIGGGGANIKRMRSQYQCTVKASDTDVQDEKIVVISGYAPNVLSTFDMLANTLCLPNREEVRRLTILVESRHAGKVIGSKGSTIRDIKMKSRAQSVKLSPENTVQCGVSFRELTFDGDFEALKACHYHLHAQFVPLRFLNPKKYADLEREREREREHDLGRNRDGREGRQSPPVAMQIQPSGPVRETLQFEDLIPSGYSIPTETVEQLKDMRHYLKSSFRLELVVTRVVENLGHAPMGPGPNVGRGYNIHSNQHHHQQGPPPVHHHSSEYHQPHHPQIHHQDNHPSHQQSMHYHQHHQHHGGNMMNKSHTPRDGPITTRIRHQHTGALIGKGGKGIRELNDRFSCRVEISQETAPDGTREVTISPDSRFGGSIDRCMQCKREIHHIIDQG